MGNRNNAHSFWILGGARRIYDVDTKRGAPGNHKGGRAPVGLRGENDLRDTAEREIGKNPHQDCRNKRAPPAPARGGPRRSGKSDLVSKVKQKNGKSGISGELSHNGIFSVNLKRATDGCQENWRGGADGSIEAVRIEGDLILGDFEP